MEAFRGVRKMENVRDFLRGPYFLPRPDPGLFDNVDIFNTSASHHHITVGLGYNITHIASSVQERCVELQDTTKILCNYVWLRSVLIIITLKFLTRAERWEMQVEWNADRYLSTTAGRTSRIVILTAQGASVK